MCVARPSIYAEQRRIDLKTDIARINRGLAIRRAKKKANDWRAHKNVYISRHDNACNSRVQ